MAVQTDTHRNNQPVSLQQLLSNPAVSSASSKVELSEEEKERVLNDALLKKQWDAEIEAKQQRQEAYQRAMMKSFTAQDMAYFAEMRVKKLGLGSFDMDDNNEEVIHQLCRYFTNDPDFCKADESYSLDKGIMLCGDVGCGKTTLMQLFARNQKASYDMCSTRKIANMYSDLGPELLHRFSDYVNVPLSLDTFYQKQIGLCFDDLGTETVKKHYGDAANCMEQIILNRYDNGIPFYLTHFTTNLPAEEIEKYYGTRARSRLREMVNMIVLPGADRRK